VSKRPTLPNLLIIGAAKAGTTSLHGYLSLHPEVYMSRQKELSYFDGLRWSKGCEWYKSNFDASYAVNGEASPRYTLYPKLSGVPERIRDLLGTPKMIYIVRDPVDRILSNYTQNVDWWPESDISQLEDTKITETEYFQYSCYYSQLERYLKMFSKESIHIVIMERLNADPANVLRDVFRFVGVKEDFWSPRFDRRLNTGDEKRYIAPWFDRSVPAALKTQLDNPSWLPWRVSTAMRRISRMGGKSIIKPALEPGMDIRLQNLLKSEVASLRTLLGDALPEWRPYA
jgi:hypothetical protein